MAQSAEQVTDLGRGHRPAAKTVNPPSLQHSASDLMKILFHPASGRWGNSVAYQSRYGQALRNYCVPRNGRTPAQQRMREVFGRNSRTWSRGLSQEQRDRWNLAGPQVMSHPRCGQRGPLTGAQFFEGINSVLGCVGLPPLWEPPARVLFGLSPVRQLVITNNERGVRLFLNLAAPPAEDIMGAHLDCTTNYTANHSSSQCLLWRASINASR